MCVVATSVLPPSPVPANSSALHSIGSGGDWGFEQGLKAAAPNCEMHTFDPAPDEIQPYGGGAYSKIHALALRGGESTSENALTLGQIQARLGHTGRHIDLLKVDCEGCEWDALTRVFGDLRAGNLTVGQIQVELHAPVSITKSEERGDRAERKRIRGFPNQLREFFDTANAAGFYIFHKERNGWGVCDGYLCVEYALVHVSHACHAFVESHCPSLPPEALPCPAPSFRASS